MDFVKTGSFASQVQTNKTYVIAILECVAAARVHVLPIERHEGRIDHDAEGDEQGNMPQVKPCPLVNRSQYLLNTPNNYVPEFQGKKSPCS